jgi:Na+/alanine symporter
MTLPNLIGLFLLRNEIKETIKEYVGSFNKAYPNEPQLK